MVTPVIWGIKTMKRKYLLSVLSLFLLAGCSAQTKQTNKKSSLEEVVITNSITHDTDLPKIKVLSIASLLAEAITKIYNDESLNTLFV